MALSYDLISQFAKLTSSEKKQKTETTVYGTVIQGENGTKYVKIDGSDLLTPLTDDNRPSTDSALVTADPGDRVSVLIKDHSATVTGNASAPSAKDSVVSGINDHVQANTALIGRLDADIVNVRKLMADKAEIGDLEAATAKITELEADHGEFKELVADSLEATYADIEQLTAKQGDFEQLTAENFKAVNADVENLDAKYAKIDYATINQATIDSLTSKYVNVDFANLTKVQMEEFYAKSGLIQYVTSEDATVTGHLVGVTITGDLIEGGTVKADKLVILGDDGVYYKLNYEAGVLSGDEVAKTYYYAATYDPETESYTSSGEPISALEGTKLDGVLTVDGKQVYRLTDGTFYCVEVVYPDWAKNSLHGSVITAKSITAEKVRVSDLVAFGATIGGFHITDNALYSGVKSSADSPIKGTYMDTEGQFSIGDDLNFLRYFKTIDDAGNEVYKLEISAESIFFGASRTSAADLKALTEHVKIGTYTEPGTDDAKPCVELAEGDSNYKQVITNTKTMFVDGPDVKTEINADGIESENVTARGEIRHGGYVRVLRANGNYGLIWREDN